MGELHVFEVKEDGERHLVVAMDEADVTRVLEECGFIEQAEDAPTRKVTRLAPGHHATVSDLDHEAGSWTQPCSQWIEQHGRGLLGSTAY